MLNNAKQAFNRVQPLPSDFSAELRAIDDALSEAAQKSPVPVGLSERVFEASSGLLTRHGATSSQPEVRTLRFPQLRFAQLSRGRLAMAASLAMAFGVAVWFLQPHSSPPSDSVVAVDGDGWALNRAAHSSVTIDLPEAFELLPTDSVAQRESEYVPYLVTSEVTYAEDLHDALVMLSGGRM